MCVNGSADLCNSGWLRLSDYALVIGADITATDHCAQDMLERLLYDELDVQVRAGCCGAMHETLHCRHTPSDRYPFLSPTLHVTVHNVQVLSANMIVSCFM